MEGLNQVNVNYMQEGLFILELMQDIKNVYVRSDFIQRSALLGILLSNCELKGVNTSFHWNKPFDILLEMGQNEKRGE